MQSRLGVVLRSATMMDDVVDLVMVQVISNLDQSSEAFSTAIVVRPLLVSLAFAFFATSICVFGVWPATTWLNGRRDGQRGGVLNRTLNTRGTAFALHTVILLEYITAATYAGMSNLLAAYIAGASIHWWDTEVPHLAKPGVSQAATVVAPYASNLGLAILVGKSRDANISSRLSQAISSLGSSGVEVYEKYYATPMNRLLKALFFVCLPIITFPHLLTAPGLHRFSIPITETFSGQILWKGLVYTLLMMLRKVRCGAWLLRLSFRYVIPTLIRKRLPNLNVSAMNLFWGRSSTSTPVARPDSTHEGSNTSSTSESTPMVPSDNSISTATSPHASTSCANPQ